MPKRNPPRTVADPVAARELFLYITNDYDLYKRNISMVLKNLSKKIQKGTYDRKKALKLWGYSAEWGAQKYARDFGGTWHQMFNKSTRTLVAKELQDYYQESLEQMNLSRLKKMRNPRSRFTSRMLQEEIDDLNNYYGLTSKTGKFVLSQAYGGNQIQWQIAGRTATRGITSGYDTPRNAWNSFYDPEYYVKRYKNEKMNPVTRRRKSYDPGATTLIMVPPSIRTTRKMQKPKTTKKKKNPGGCSMTRKNPAVPKGKRKGDHFTRKGKRYVVVSFTNSNGTRVRYARKVKKSRRKGRKGR